MYIFYKTRMQVIRGKDSVYKNIEIFNIELKYKESFGTKTKENSKKVFKNSKTSWKIKPRN